MIECRELCALAGSFLLRDVSFVVPTGGHAVITGPTASGKTTLLELIAGATLPTAGEVLIAGRNVTMLAPELRGVGLVPQHGALFPHLSVRRNMQYGARDSATVRELARRFGIDALMGRSIATLSGGERQLVALCRALATRPTLLLLDEPLSALDDVRRTTALREIAAIQAEEHLTLIHVTHEERDAASATMRLTMNDGRLTAR